jgi:hypothetical protein
MNSSGNDLNKPAENNTNSSIKNNSIPKLGL